MVKIADASTKVANFEPGPSGLEAAAVTTGTGAAYSKPEHVLEILRRGKFGLLRLIWPALLKHPAGEILSPRGQPNLFYYFRESEFS